MLSFPIDGDPAARPIADDGGPAGARTTPPWLLGDVVICPAVAAANAPSHAGTYDDELALLVVHGVLHVLGIDHAERRRAPGHAGPRARAARSALHGPLAGDPWAG